VSSRHVETGEHIPGMWPQEHISVDCLAILSLDVTAPFLADMGLPSGSLPHLRRVLRARITEDPEILSAEGASVTDKTTWLVKLFDALRSEGRESIAGDFESWIRNTYTLAPADRPNWETYESWFYEWAARTRGHQGRTGLFANEQLIYDSYVGFVHDRDVSNRLERRRFMRLTPWDSHIFDLRGFTTSEDLIDHETWLDPFLIVRASSSRNHFQEFWEYIIPLLTSQEMIELHRAAQQCADPRLLAALVAPLSLVRDVA
jgi:hypothetical protein